MYNKESLKKSTLTDLRKIAEDLNLYGYQRLKKEYLVEEIIKALEDNNELEEKNDIQIENPETDYIAEGILEVMPDGYGFLRRVGIKLISSCIHFKTRVRIYDTTSGFRASNKNAIAMFAIHYPLEYPEPISSVDVILSGMKIKEVPVSMNERLAGKSSINSWKNVYYMVNVVLSILLRKRGK